MSFQVFSRGRLFAAACVLAAGPAAAAVFTVGPGADCSHVRVQDALDAAAANGPDEDEIRLVAAEHTLQRLRVEQQSVTVSGGWASCAADAMPIGATALIGGHEAGAPGTDAVLRVRADGLYTDVTLRRLVIRDGSGGADGHGGGIDAAGSVRVVLQDVEVLDNRVDGNGGGIALAGTNLAGVLELHAGVRIAGNVAGQAGGGVYLERASARIRADRTEIGGNRAARGGGLAAVGGSIGIGSVGEPDVQHDATGARIIGNAAQRGGGVHLEAGALFDAHELTLSFNHAEEAGGGLYASGGAQVRMQRSYSNVFAVQCRGTDCARIEGNQAGDGCPGTRGEGGGLYLEADTRATLRQLALIDNCAWGSPGAISWGTQLDLEGVLVAGNRLTWREGANYTGRRVISYASRVGAVPAAARLSFVTFARNVEVRGADTFPADATSALGGGDRWHYAVDAIATADPLPASGGLSQYGVCNRAVTADMFADAAAGDYRPRADGALVDACAADPVDHEALDLALAPRCVDHPRPDQGGRCDIGAYELQVTVPADRIFADAFESR